MSHIGLHCTWDVSHASAEKLSYIPSIKALMYVIIEKLNMTPVEEAFKQFDPVGVTGFVLLEESHISIHTWPERQYAAIDVFSCNDFDASLVKTLLATHLASDHIKVTTLKREAL